MATATEQRNPGNWMDTDRRVRHPLHAVRGYIRTFVLLEGFGLALLYVAFAFWLGLLVDWGLFQAFAFDWVQELQELMEGQGGDFWLRLTLPVIAVLGLLTLLVMKTVFRLFREFSDASMALVLERRFPRELGDRLITAVELADPKLAAKYSYSLPMVQKTIREAAERVEKLPVRSVFNWARLRRIFLLFGVLSLGMYLLVGLSVCAGDALRHGEFDPAGYMYRFGDTSAIWLERNILLRDSYWPRSAYLELIGFHDTPEHPNEMRVGRNETRADLQARAIEWVTADHRVRGGWRPMRFTDLDRFMDASELAVLDIPTDWPGWIIDLDDFPGRVPGSAFPPDDWQGLTSGTIRARLAQPDMSQTVAAAKMTKTVNDLLDWRTWTIDRIALQLQNDQVRLALRASYPDATKALEKIVGIHGAVLWSDLKNAILARETMDRGVWSAGTVGLLVSPLGQGPSWAGAAPLLRQAAFFPGHAARELAKVNIPAAWPDWVIKLNDLTGRDGGTITLKKSRISDEETWIAVEKIKVQVGKGKFDEETKKSSFEDGKDVEEGLKSELFAKEVPAIVVTSNGKIAEIRVLEGEEPDSRLADGLDSTSEMFCTIRKVNPESDFPPAAWDGLTSGAFREKLGDPALAAKAAKMTPPLTEQLDWQTWTIARILSQMEKVPVSTALSAGHPEAVQALEMLFGKEPSAGIKELPQLAADPSMSRRLRQLEVPTTVKVRYRGSNIKNDDECLKQPGNKYTVGLAKLKESVRFTVIANDYYTPYRHITLRPPPTIDKMMVEKEEPAYIYFRLQGDQGPLKGKKRSNRNEPINKRLTSISGGDSTEKVPLGTDLTLTAFVEPERLINGADDVWIGPPDRAQHTGSQVPDVPIEFSRVFTGAIADGEFACIIRKAADGQVLLTKITKDGWQNADETLAAAKGVRVQLGTGNLNKDTSEFTYTNARDLADGLENHVFAREVRAIVAANVVGNITEIRVLRGGEGFEDRLVIHLPHLVRSQEFAVYFRDQDKVKGKHQIRVVVDDDQPPELADIDLDAVLRTARFRNDAGAAVAAPTWASEAMLITPDALLPIKGAIKDDHGLTKVEWRFEVEQVEIELQGDMPARSKSSNRAIGRAALLASGLQVLPGQTGMALYGPAYLAWMTRKLVEDLEAKSLEGSSGEESRMLRSFESRLHNHGGALTLSEVQDRLAGKTAPRELFKKHSWRGLRANSDWTDDQDGFDLREYLPKLKSPDPQQVAQLHYFLKVSVSATDNNVETGPSSSRNKKPFQFLVVSEMELIAQIVLEEELLADRLTSVYEKLSNGKTILGEQVGKMGDSEPKYAEIGLRLDTATREISEAFGKTREVLSDFTRIKEEMRLNRARGSDDVNAMRSRGTKYQILDSKILEPLEVMLDQNADPKVRGEFPKIEDLLLTLQDLVNADAQDAAKGGKSAGQQRMQRKDALEDAQKKVDTLMVNLNKIREVLQQGINDEKLLDRAKELERKQRQLAERWRMYHQKKVIEELEKLTK